MDLIIKFKDIEKAEKELSAIAKNSEKRRASVILTEMIYSQQNNIESFGLFEEEFSINTDRGN